MLTNLKKLFNWHTQQWIFNKVIIKDPTKRHACYYNTSWNLLSASYWTRNVTG